MNIKIYTDGACSNNGGNDSIGAWAFVIVQDEKVIVSNQDSECYTTNNRMELKAIIESLEKLKEKIDYFLDEYKNVSINVFSDSSYCVSAFTKGWLKNWKLNGWKTKQKSDVKNVDLWKKIDDILYSYKNKNVKIRFTKIKGHSGNEFNEMCDEMAKLSIQKLRKSED